MLTDTIKAKLKLAVEAQRQPKQGKKSGDYILRFGGGGYKVLLKDGVLTEAGEYAKGLGLDLPEEGYDLNEVPTRKGRTDYLTVKNKLSALRTLDPITGDYKYTALGRKYYRSQKKEYVVSIPVTVRGKRLNGSEYIIRGFMPATALGVPKIMQNASLTQRQRVSKIKSEVLKNFADHRYLNGELVLNEVSDELYTYARDREWRISELNTSVDGGSVDAVLDRPLQKLPKIYPLVPNPLDLLDEAIEWVDDVYCVPRQMAQLLNKDYAIISDQFDDLIGSNWREEGISSRQVLEYAEAYDHTAYVFWQSKCIDSRKGSKKALCWSVEAGHMFMYRSFRKLLEKTGEVKKERLKKLPKLRPVVKDVFEEVKEGAFYTDDLHSLRLRLLAKNLPVQATLSSPHELRMLKVPIAKGKYCVITSRPENHDELHQFVEDLQLLTRVPLTYRQEGLPALTQRMLLTLLAQKRRHLSVVEKRAILRAQKHKCNECGQELTKYECDHVIPLSRATSQNLWQFLCEACHTEKTWAQSCGPVENMLASSFNTTTWKQFVESPKVKALVFEAHALEPTNNKLLLDVIRCRANCLKHASHSWPVYAPIDEVVVAENRTYDFAYIDCRKTFRCGQNVLASLPYTGPGWYGKPCQEYGLNMGLWKYSDFKFGFDASGHLPNDIMKQPISWIQEAWGDKIQGKLGINAMLGLWVETHDSCYALRTTSEECDELMNDFFCKVPVGDFEGTPLGLWDYVYKTNLLSGGTSMRVIHQYVMEYEHLKMAWALHLIKQAGVLPRQIKQLCTDSILFQPAKLRKKRCLEIADTQFRDLKRPRNLAPTAVQTVDSEELVYRVEEKDKRLHGQYKLPTRQNFPVAVDHREWTDVDPHEAIARGESIYIEGRPGTGKSHLARELIEFLRGQGKRVAVVSKCHTAALNMSGVTVQHFCFKYVLHGSFQGDYVVLDEVSQLELGLWIQLNKLSFVGVKWILLGDFEQFPPVGQHIHAGQTLDDDCVQKSSLLKLMADNNRCVLTENMRSDQKLFDFYNSLVLNGNRVALDLKTVLAEARKLFPRKRGWPDTSLVISHAMRRRLNEKQNQALKPEGALQIFGADGEMWLHQGLRLVGHMQERRLGCVNNACYVILNVQPEEVKLECEATKRVLDVPMHFVQSSMRLGFCRTQASVQGATIPNRLRIYSNHPRFSKRHLYVCASRCTNHALLEVI